MIDMVTSHVILWLLLALVVLPIVYMAFLGWLRHRRQAMIHRERLAAIEKGIDLPILDQETLRRSWNVQQILLLAGLSWISVGITTFVVLRTLLTHSSEFADQTPKGLEWIGLAPVGIGISHLIVYFVGRRNNQ
jgi:uncharacterized membrane protein YbhN (UPF0104 family)